MAHLELSTEINTPPQAVWDLTVDFQRIPELAPATSEKVSYVTKGKVGVGTVFREKVRIGPIKSEDEWHITEFDPPRRHVHVGSKGPMKISVAVEIEPTDRGALLRHTVDVRMMPFFRPLGLLLEALFLRRQLESTLHSTHANVKRILEGAELNSLDSQLQP